MSRGGVGEGVAGCRAGVVSAPGLSRAEGLGWGCVKKACAVVGGLGDFGWLWE